MSQSRLRTAVDDGLLTLPDGDICVMRPSADYDISVLDRDSVQILHSFFPAVAQWQGAGFSVVQDMPKVAVAIVVVPRAKALARAMVAAACAQADLVVVDGQKTDGTDSLFKQCRKVLGDLPSVPKAHGRIFWFDATDAFADWAASAPVRGPHGYVTTAGVFSDGEIDKGSAFLADALPAKLPARMADLGAGWGYLAGPVLSRDGVTSLDLIEAEALALDCARQNVTDPRASFHWADATQFAATPPYDGIIMNPPFHTSRTAEPALGQAFIQAAARLLQPNGKLWMVANRHLPYEAAMTENFRNVDTIAMNGAFKVFFATKPRQPRR